MLKHKSISINLDTSEDKNEYHAMRALLCIAQSIYQARKRKGLSQKQLADLCGTTQRIISNLENADINVGFNLLFRISKELGIDFNFGTHNLLKVSSKNKDFSFDISSLRKKNALGDCVNV